MKNKAFSLVELSIVLIIVGMLIGSSLILGKVQIEKSKYDITISRLDLIHDALVLYLSLNGRLPCPANLSVASTDASYGLERISSSASGPQTCITSSNELFDISDGLDALYMGAIPFKSLTLSNDFMFDGWDNKITYVVQKAFINNHILNTFCTTTANASDDHTNDQYLCFRAQASGSTNSVNNDINILQASGGNSVTRDAVYVLISHGDNGLGAFRSTSDASGNNTDRNALPSSTDRISERENTNCSASTSSCSSTALNDRNFAISGGISEADTFDDIVFFRTRNYLVYDCNKDYNNACSNSWGLEFK